MSDSSVQHVLGTQWSTLMKNSFFINRLGFESWLQTQICLLTKNICFFLAVWS